MFEEITNFFTALTGDFSKTEIITIVAILAILYFLAFVAKKVVFVLYNRSKNEVIVSVMERFICGLDEFADNMTNADKRAAAIDKLQSLLSYKVIRLPRFVLGWIIDMQVAEIRRLQSESEKDTDLHKD